MNRRLARAGWGLGLACGAVLLTTQPLCAAGLFSKPAHTAPAAATDATMDALASQIRQALDERRDVDAAGLLDEAARLKFKSPKFSILQGDLLLTRGHFDQALAAFRVAAAAPTPDPEAQQGIGLSLSQMGRSDEAMQALQLATTQDKSLWRAWNGLGREYDIRHDWAKAAAAYAAALSVPGANQAIILNNRGYSHLLRGERELASADFVAALQKDPSLAAARTNLRITLAMEGSYSRAASTGVGDDRAAVLNNVGLTAAMRGDYLQAEKLLNEAIAAKGQYYARAAENLQLSKDMAARADEPPAGANAPH